MRTYEAIVADMRDGHTFSNASQYEYWAAAWCYRCRWERIRNPGEPSATGCNISGAAMIHTGRIPAEWTLSDAANAAVHGDFVCSEFEEWRDGGRGDGKGPRPPRPRGPGRQCTGQLDIIDAALDDTIAEWTRPVDTPATV